jgi:hypothetical protein
MLFILRASPRRLAAVAALVGSVFLPITVRADSTATRAGQAEPVVAQFRGCEPAGWCRFLIEPPEPAVEPLLCVRPAGIPQMPGDDAVSLAVRDRLNALLASMIHQHKRIVLHDLRELGDGTFAATVTVNGVDLATDPVLVELHEKAARTTR